MKRPLVAVTLFALLALGVFSLWPRGGASTPAGTLLDVLARLRAKPDTVAFARLERERDSLDARTRALNVFWEGRARQFAESIAVAQRASEIAASRTIRHQRRADSLAAVLARTRDDDDSLPRLVALVAAKDSVIVAVTSERDAAMGRVSVLERAVEARDSALVLYHRALTEAMRQRDSYRKLSGSRSLVRAGAVLVATVAVCRAVPDPC